MTGSTNPGCTVLQPLSHNLNGNEVRTKGAYEWEVEQLICGTLFPKFKFITSDSIMDYSKEKSLCQIILTGIHFTVENKQLFWNQVKPSVFNMMRSLLCKLYCSSQIGFGGKCNF